MQLFCLSTSEISVNTQKNCICSPYLDLPDRGQHNILKPCLQTVHYSAHKSGLLYIVLRARTRNIDYSFLRVLPPTLTYAKDELFRNITPILKLKAALSPAKHLFMQSFDEKKFHFPFCCFFLNLFPLFTRELFHSCDLIQFWSQIDFYVCWFFPSGTWSRVCRLLAERDRHVSLRVFLRVFGQWKLHWRRLLQCTRGRCWNALEVSTRMLR